MKSQRSDVPTTLPPGVFLYAAALCTALVVGPRGPVYWDSFGYVRDALTGRLSGLGAGRPWFSIAGRMILRVATSLGFSPWSAEPVLRNAWMLVAALAAPAAHALARACGLTPRAAVLAGIAVACSPAMAHTSRAVLSDGPAVAIALLALGAAVRATAANASRLTAAREATLAGVLLALAIGLREQSVFVLASFAWLVVVAPPRTRLAAGGAMVLALGLALALTASAALRVEPHWFGHFAAWREAMRHERATQSYGLRDVGRYLAWLVALGPLALAAGLLAWWRARDELLALRGPLAAVCVPALAQLALLGGYQDIAYSPRYLLLAMPGALALPAAIALDRWLDSLDRDAVTRSTALVLAGLVAPAALAAPVLRQRERPLRAILDALPTQLVNLPDDAVIVTGQPCPAIHLQRTLHNLTESRRRHWQVVCPGWSWPADLEAALSRARTEGRTEGVRTLVLDLRTDAWLGAGQQRARAQVAAYERRHGDDVARGHMVVWW